MEMEHSERERERDGDDEREREKMSTDCERRRKNCVILLVVCAEFGINIVDRKLGLRLFAVDCTHQLVNQRLLSK